MPARRNSDEFATRYYSSAACSNVANSGLAWELFLSLTCRRNSWWKLFFCCCFVLSIKLRIIFIENPPERVRLIDHGFIHLCTCATKVREQCRWRTNTNTREIYCWSSVFGAHVADGMMWCLAVRCPPSVRGPSQQTDQ